MMCRHFRETLDSRSRKRPTASSPYRHAHSRIEVRTSSGNVSVQGINWACMSPAGIICVVVMRQPKFRFGKITGWIRYKPIPRWQLERASGQETRKHTFVTMSTINPPQQPPIHHGCLIDCPSCRDCQSGSRPARKKAKISHVFHWL